MVVYVAIQSIRKLNWTKNPFHKQAFNYCQLTKRIKQQPKINWNKFFLSMWRSFPPIFSYQINCFFVLFYFFPQIYHIFYNFFKFVLYMGIVFIVNHSNYPKANIFCFVNFFFFPFKNSFLCLSFCFSSFDFSFCF